MPVNTYPPIFAKRAWVPPPLGIDSQTPRLDSVTAADFSLISPPWFGDGSAGDLTYTTTQTLTQNLYARNLTLSTGAIVQTVQYKLFVSGTLTVTANATIRNNGNAASGSTAGAKIPSAVLNQANPGVAGIAGGTGATGVQEVNALGGAGGAGGNGSGAGTGGPGGTVTQNTPAMGGPGVHTVWDALLCSAPALNNFLVDGYGAAGTGGSGGAPASTTGVGGGSGGSAGIIPIYANAIVVNPGVTLTIQAKGGAGGNATAGTAAGVGGGGGAGGGAIVLVYTTKLILGTLTLDVSGGAGGSPTGTGTAGSTGSTGNIYQIQV